MRVVEDRLPSDTNRIQFILVTLFLEGPLTESEELLSHIHPGIS